MRKFQVVIGGRGRKNMSALAWQICLIHTHKIMYIFLQPAHTKACTKEVRIINGRSPWVSPGATKEGLQKRPQEPEEARADAGFLWFFV